MANNTGTLVIAAIRPWADTDTFASAYANEIKGGLHCVTTDESRDAIPSARIEDGMLVAVSNSIEAGGNRAIYQRQDSSWVPFSPGEASINELYLYLDGSLSARDLKISQLDASIIRIDASLNDTVDLLDILDASLANYATLAYTDGSLSARDLKISQLDASLENVIDRIDIIDASLENYATIVYIDGSLAERDTSILSLQNNKLNNTSDTFTGLLTLNGSLFIVGDIIQNGSTYITHVENLDVSSNLITLREGAITPLPDGSLSGFLITKPDGTNDLFIGTDNDGILRIGWVNDDYQAVATREDNPTDGWFTYWDDSSSMFKTKNLIGIIDASYALKTYVDGSLALRDTQIQQLDASIIRIDANYATNASIGLAGFAKDASLALYVKKTGDIMSGGLIIDASLTVSYIYTKDGSVSGETLNIKAGKGGITGNGGNIVMIAGDRDPSATPGPGGQVYISPGRQTDGGGDYINSVKIGHPTYNSREIGLQAEGQAANVGFTIQQKGSAAIMIGKASAGTYLYGSGIQIGANNNYLAFNSGAQTLEFSASDGTIRGGWGIQLPKGGDLTIEGGRGYSYSSYHGDGGNLYLRGGNADSSIAPNIGGDVIIQGGQGINGGINGGIKMIELPEVSTLSILYYDSDSGEVTYAEAPGAGGVSYLSSLIDVSIVDISYGHVLVFDPCMGNEGLWKNVKPIDVSLEFTSKYTSFDYKTAAYTLDIYDLNNIVEASGTFAVTLPNSVNPGFQTTIINVGGGNITLNASTLLTMDSSIVLRDRYATATAVHKGSGVWYASGNLK